jgi:hypothetical protein
MKQNGTQEAMLYYCRSCGAPLEVRVGFRGRLVWTVTPEDAVFGNTEPELRGDYQDPQLVCSADVMHSTGFKLEDGVIAADPKFDG